MKDSKTIVRFIFNSGLSHLKFKFSGSKSSAIWVIANPLFYILLYTFVFSHVFKLDHNTNSNISGNFVGYLCMGLLPWLIWAEGLFECSSCLNDNGYYLKKIALPTWVFVAKSCLAFLIYNLIATIILILFLLLSGYSFNLYWFLIPLHIIIFHLFSFGICLITSMLAVFTKDVAQALNMFIQLIFWSMPIVYYTQNLPSTLQEIIKYHPIYQFIIPIRKIVLEPTNYSLTTFAITILISLAVICIGMLIHKKFEHEIRDAL